MILSKCAVCDSEKSKCIKQQEANGLLSSLGIKTHLNKIHQQVHFCFNSIKQVNRRYKMNEIENKFLLAGDEFITETHLRQPGFT